MCLSVFLVFPVFGQTYNSIPIVAVPGNGYFLSETYMQRFVLPTFGSDSCRLRDVGVENLLLQAKARGYKYALGIITKKFGIMSFLGHGEQKGHHYFRGIFLSGPVGSTGHAALSLLSRHLQKNRLAGYEFYSPASVSGKRRFLEKSSSPAGFNSPCGGHRDEHLYPTARLGADTVSSVPCRHRGQWVLCSPEGISAQAQS